MRAFKCCLYCTELYCSVCPFNNQYSTTIDPNKGQRSQLNYFQTNYWYIEKLYKQVKQGDLKNAKVWCSSIGLTVLRVVDIEQDSLE